MAEKTHVPGTASDTMMHVKDSDKTERIILPYTRYDNVLSAPNVVSDVDQKPGAPFHFLVLDYKEMTRAELRAAYGGSIGYGEANDPDQGIEPPIRHPRFTLSSAKPDYPTVWLEPVAEGGSEG